MRIAWLATALVVVGGAPLGAQHTPHGRMPAEGEDFCAQIFVRADGRVIGHEYAEFLYEPAAADDASAALHPDLEGHAPVRAGRVALWWAISPDSLGAHVVGEEGTVWQIRAGPGMGALEGTLRRIVPPDSPDVAGAYVMAIPCPESREPR